MSANETVWESGMQTEDSAVRVETRNQDTGNAIARGSRQRAGSAVVNKGDERNEVMNDRISSASTHSVLDRQASRLVPLAELQTLYGFSTRWWRYRIREGLPSRKWLGGLRFDPAEVEAWLDRC
jgi:hypothetical protein